MIVGDKMIKFAITIYILVLACGAASAIITFLYDVIKWHSMEKKENIISSAQSYYSKGGVLNGRYGSIGADRGRRDNDNDNDNGESGRGNNDNNNGTDDNNNVFDL